MLRGRLEGIDAQVCWKLLGIRDLAEGRRPDACLPPGQSAGGVRRHRTDVRADLRAAGFDVALIKANASKLRTLIAGLAWNPRRSAWSEYAACGHYKDPDTAQKIEFVRAVAAARDWNLVWDLGCNVGRYSRLAAERARSVVAIDARPPRHRPAVSGLEGGGSPEHPPARRRPDRPVSGSWLAKSGAQAAHCAGPARSRAVPGAHPSRRDRRQHSAGRVSRVAARPGCGCRDRVRDEEGSDGQRLLRNKEDQYADYDLAAFRTPSSRRASPWSVVSRSGQEPASCITGVDRINRVQSSFLFPLDTGDSPCIKPIG